MKLQLLLWAFLFAQATGAKIFYFDSKDNSLETYQKVGNKVELLYGEKFKKPIVLKLKDTKGGRFNCRRNEIIVFKGYSKVKLSRTVAHESAHLMNCQLSDRKNTEEWFRFIDEGLASIIGHRVTMNEEKYKQQVRKEAKEELEKGKVSFEQVKKWKEYFGTIDSPKKNWKSYRVGSSFIYYLSSKFGKDAPFKLLKLLATKSFEDSLYQLVGKKVEQVESEWLEFIKKE